VRARQERKPSGGFTRPWLCKLERCRVQRPLARPTGLLSSVPLCQPRIDSNHTVMAVSCPLNTSNSPRRDASLSPTSDLPTCGEGPLLDESSPLLKHKSTHFHRKAIYERRCIAWSSFLDDNLGLLLVGLSQFFFSAMGTAVKWLNSLDEPVPTLEVNETRRERIFSLR